MPPVYSVIKTDGPPHARRFTVEAAWASGKTRGHGPSIKAAEMMVPRRRYRYSTKPIRTHREEMTYH